MRWRLAWEVVFCFEAAGGIALKGQGKGYAAVRRHLYFYNILCILPTMLQTPWEYLIKVAKKVNTETKDEVRYIFGLSDQFSLWIIGLSLGSLSLLLSTLKDILSYISVYNLKIVLFFLFLSALLGVIYRIVFIFYYIQNNKALRIMDFYLTDDERQDIESSLKGNESYDDLIELNQQFVNLNADALREEYNSSDDIGRIHRYNTLVAWYTSAVREAKKDFDWTRNDIAERYNEYVGINKKNFYKEYSNKPLLFTKYTSIFLYFGFMATFFFAVAFFLFTINIHK